MVGKFENINTSIKSTTQESTIMDSQTIAQVTHTLQTVAIATLFLAICVYVPKLKLKAQLGSLPALNSGESREKHRKTYLTSAKKMYANGYAKFKDSVYRIAGEQGEDNIVIPPSLLPELRKLPDDVLSFPVAVKDLMEVKYTKLRVEGATGLHAVKSDLTPALPRLNPVIASEVDAALREAMPPCEDWTEVSIFKELVDVIAKVSGRIFVGPELCRNPEYIKLGSNYTIDLVGAVTAVKQVRPWLKPFLCHRLPEVVKLRKCEQQLKEFLRPIIEERMNAKSKDPNWQEPDDMLQWMITRGRGKDSINDITAFQLSLIFAAIHTTSMTVTSIMHTLAVTPEYVDPLREEIRNVMANNDGIITSRALQQMEKVDSYMKEVLRVYPTAITAFTRRVLKGITLSNGQYIPPGVTIEVPSAAVYLDEKNYPSADEFDGFRAYKLRASGKAADIARNQFVTANETNLNFGYGAHACPGRFFAANEIKMVLVRLILEYDVKMPNGETERYATIDVGTQSMPDSTKSLAFKKVQI
ncbi:CypX Cytochrome P450 [Pyrenophora tritici-repentis]|nr:CypX cytochrome P450 [Pyrenophora tritici-repentis]KAI0604312.1 CypX Cytochrome P450 [Pyrenophora tritici-repentis]KAI0616475.1 CypX Cytochrome P450 [Pyrenophora tritici-repentis]